MVKTDLVSKLAQDFPKITFEEAEDFYWSPDKETVYFSTLKNEDDTRTLLHEVGHALLNHTNFTRDIELLKIEREAWQYAKEQLSHTYGIAIDDDYIEGALESYRDWLHNRSRCPHCSLTGVQVKGSVYRCLGCAKGWRVNDARRCALRRYGLTPKNAP